MKNFFLSAVILSAPHAIAQTVGPAESDLNPEISNLLKKTPEVEDHSPRELIYPYQFSFRPGISSGTFHQSGSGQNYESKSAEGKGFSFDFRRYFNQASVLITGGLNETIFREPDSIGGKSVPVRRANLLVGTGLSARRDSYDLDFHLGLGVSTQNSAAFTGGEKLVPQYLSSGPGLGSRFVYKLSRVIQLHSSFDVYLPLFMKDTDRDNGSFDYGVNARVGGGIDFSLSKRLTLTLGVVAEGEWLEFSGEADRGVSDAEVSYLALNFPAGVTYAF